MNIERVKGKSNFNPLSNNSRAILLKSFPDSPSIDFSFTNFISSFSIALNLLVKVHDSIASIILKVIKLKAHFFYPEKPENKMFVLTRQLHK